MSSVCTFRASSVRLALQLVRERLGDDAVIVETRETIRRRRLPWRKPEPLVEVVAGLDLPFATPAEILQLDEQAEFQLSAETQLSAADSSNERESFAKPDCPESDGRRADDPGTEQGVIAETLDGNTQPCGTEDSADADRSPAGGVQPALGQPSLGASSQDASHDLLQRMEVIERMLERVGVSAKAPAGTVSDELFEFYTELLDRDVDEPLARELLAQVERVQGSPGTGGRSATLQTLLGLVESRIRCGGPIQLEEGRRRVVGLVGPTGVGKTTTLAKLAANFRIRDGVRMGLVTVDTYRIAAVEQLRTYAEIIDLPMRVVTSPQEMRRAIDELTGLDLVLIDTAGRSPRDELKLQELRGLFAEAEVDEVHLVLSLNASQRHLLETARKFSVAGPTSIIATKLDEACGLGSLLAVANETQLPFSYVTTGQAVPDDIEAADAGRLARLILGQDLI